MTQTIGNPASWLAGAFGRASHHAVESSRRMGGIAHLAAPRTRRLHMGDIGDALRAGWADFKACRTDVMFLVLIYPVIGLVLMAMGFDRNLIPLIFPLMAGFAILGPVAAVGVYEISRRRERGEDTGLFAALKVVQRPRFSAVVMLGLYLCALFIGWMLIAAGLHSALLGDAPASLSAFADQVFGTAAGWTMIVVGCGLGFAIALAVLAISLVSFPLLIDRPVGLPVAVSTSIQVTRENPKVVLTWGAVIAAGLILGSLPMLLGLVVVLPVLGHATWHLYRRAIH